MIYDLVDMVDCVYFTVVADLRNCIISTILKFIMQNKFDWLNNGGLFLYLPTEWYHIELGYVGMLLWRRTERASRTCSSVQTHEQSIPPLLGAGPA